MRDQHIPSTAAPLPFTPPSLLPVNDADGAPAKPTGSEPVFSIKPLTEREFDRLGYELFRHGLVPPSNDTFRATVIDEVFEIYGDAEGEEKANLLDNYWQGEDVFRDQMAEWHEQDRQRLFDEAEGAPKRKPLPLPSRLVGVRDRNKALLFAEGLVAKSRKLREMTIEMQSYEPKQRAGIARLVILDWRNLSTPYACEDGIVPDETYEALYSEIGRVAIQELETFCASLGTVSGAERGNSASPLETGSSREDSPAPIGEPALSDGPSTSEAGATPSTSNSTPAPASGSGDGTVTSSTSTSPSTGETLSVDAIQPAPSPTPPSG